MQKHTNSYNAISHTIRPSSPTKFHITVLRMEEVYHIIATIVMLWHDKVNIGLCWQACPSLIIFKSKNMLWAVWWILPCGRKGQRWLCTWVECFFGYGQFPWLKEGSSFLPCMVLTNLVLCIALAKLRDCPHMVQVVLYCRRNSKEGYQCSSMCSDYLSNNLSNFNVYRLFQREWILLDCKTLCVQQCCFLTILSRMASFFAKISRIIMYSFYLLDVNPRETGGSAKMHCKGCMKLLSTHKVINECTHIIIKACGVMISPLVGTPALRVIKLITLFLPDSWRVSYRLFCNVRHSTHQVVLTLQSVAATWMLKLCVVDFLCTWTIMAVVSTVNGHHATGC